MTDEAKNKIIKMISSKQGDIKILGINTLVGCRVKRIIVKSEFKEILKHTDKKTRLLIKRKLNNYES